MVEKKTQNESKKNKITAVLVLEQQELAMNEFTAP